MVFKEILSIKEKFSISSQHMPKHIAVTMNGSFSHAFKKKLDPEEVCMKDMEKARSIIELSIGLNIPVLTFYVVSEKMRDSRNFLLRMKSLKEFFHSLKGWDLIHNNQAKITVLGKWYNLPSDVIEEIKAAISETKDYDTNFINFCINYDGQEEIVDACKIIARQVKADRLDPDAITKDIIKENIYASYFLPPDLIIKTGKLHMLNGFLLWDSAKARIYFTGKRWPEFSKADFLKGIAHYQSMR